jgi:hypothetical protein
MSVKHVRACFIVCGLMIVTPPLQGFAQRGSAAANITWWPALSSPDGQHDFDFELGHWTIHLKRLVHPLTGSSAWVEFDGTSVTRKVWDGLAQIEQFETDGAAGHIEGLTLRTYNPQSHQWRLYWANAKDGILLVPQIGEFKNGQGEFYAQDTLNGKSIFIRFIWSKTNSNTPHFEQSFSDDGGKTWEVNWITDQTRVPDEPGRAVAAHADPPAETQTGVAERDGQQDFDFVFGTWTYHLKRLLHPLSGSTTWVELSGTLIGHRIWDGRANLAETHADGPSGQLRGLTLRTYNPQTHQWYLYWANSRDGIIAVPQIGQFKDGTGEFLAQDTFNGKAILVRYLWTATHSPSPHFEQSYSDDGGKTWEPNWIVDQTRIGESTSATY